MEATERRLEGAIRMPVDLLVQLAHPGDHETFDADGINLSATGLGLRSAVLPDVGQRLRCRFEVPDDGAICETDAEVVWASDTGAVAGEFGVKFTSDDLEPRVRAVLDHWVTTLEGAPPRVITPVSTLAPDGWSRATGRPVRVQIDGVASPFEGTVRKDAGSNVQIEQALPFLEIGRGTTLEAGERAERRSLANVELVIDDGVPRLVLTLAKLAPRSTTRSAPPDMRSPEPRVVARNEETLQDDSLENEASAKAERATQGSSAGTEWVTSDVETPSSIDTGAAASFDDADSIDAADGSMDEPIARARHVDRADDYSIDEAPVRAARDVARMREREPARAMKIQKDDGEAPEEGPALRDRLLDLKAQAAPTLAASMAKVRAAWTIAIATTGPWARSAIAWLAKTARTIAEQVRTRAPERLAVILGRQPKRRTTAAPPAPAPALRRARGSETPAAPLPSPLRGKGRLVLAGLVAVMAVGLTAYAFAGEEEVAPPPIEVDVPVRETAPEPLTAAESGDEIPVVSATSAEAPPEVAPEPEPSGGHLPPPTFPQLGSSSSETTSVTAIAETTPAAAPVGTATEFGAASVEGARTSTLHMSQPVTSIVGQADENGFTVTIHGALSLDRAGPIAAVNPSVERASIINRGDHCVLTIRFVAGRSPAYRVAVHGQTVQVDIGR